MRTRSGAKRSLMAVPSARNSGFERMSNRQPGLQLASRIVRIDSAVLQGTVDFSTTIFEEGANVLSFKIVNDGVFDKRGLEEHMVERPARYPGSSGCRNLRDVESDLKAVCVVFVRDRARDWADSGTVSCSKSPQTTRGSSSSSRVCRTRALIRMA